jgi:hypothetical protein
LFLSRRAFFLIPYLDAGKPGAGARNAQVASMHSRRSNSDERANRREAQVFAT